MLMLLLARYVHSAAIFFGDFLSKFYFKVSFILMVTLYVVKIAQIVQGQTIFRKRHCKLTKFETKSSLVTLNGLGTARPMSSAFRLD